MIDFTRRVALVTGAGRGLGLAYARALAARGATVVVQDSGTAGDGTGDDPAIAQAAAASITAQMGSAPGGSGQGDSAQGGTARGTSMPIGTQDECHALIADITARYGRIDIVIHNAGWVGYQTIEELTPDFLSRMLKTGIDTPLWLAQAAWPTMRAAGYGRIVLTTSDRAIYPAYAQDGLTAYAAAKLGTVGIANILSREGAPHGIMVNAVSPVAKTRMWGIDGEPDELHPDRVTPGVLYLASSDCTASGWVLRAANGQFVATKASEAEGVTYPRDLATVAADSPEAVAAAWPQIAIDVPEHRIP